MPDCAMATLTVSRLRDSAGVMRSITIEVDGRPSLKVRHGQTDQVNVGPGRHTVRARMDWCSSPELTFEGDTHVEVEYPFQSFLKLFRNTDTAISIRRI